MEKTPVEVVTEHYKFPFEFRIEQAADINRLAPLDRSGWYDEVGTGKTAMSTAVALYKRIQRNDTVVLILMPPVLITQWKRWLESLELEGILAYRGTPKERAALSFEGAEFVLMSIQIFKKDYVRICGEYNSEKGIPMVVIVDEATSIKNPTSDNHKAVRDFVEAREAVFMPLTGTPLSTPMDAYGYIKLVSPKIYRNKRHFESLHVADRDFFGNVTKWTNLDLLSDNLMLNSSRILQASLGIDAPIYIPIPYELSKQHMALYRKLADEQFLLMKDGGVVNATSAAKLFNAVQQIVVNWHHFSGDPGDKSTALELVDEVIEELAVGNLERGCKLMIVSNYRMTNRYLLDYLRPYRAVAFFSEISRAQQERNYQQFIGDSACRIALVQPQSAGYGLDNFKDVCWDLLFLETPIVPRDFTQVVGRLYRSGMRQAPRVRIGIAEGTIQVRLHHRLLDKDALVNMVQGGWKDLRDAIYGG